MNVIDAGEVWICEYICEWICEWVSFCMIFLYEEIVDQLCAGRYPLFIPDVTLL